MQGSSSNETTERTRAQLTKGYQGKGTGVGITNTGLEWHWLWHRLVRDCLSWVRARLCACCRGDSGSGGLGTGRWRHRLGLGTAEERLCRNGKLTVAGGGGSGSGKLGKTRAHGQ